MTIKFTVEELEDIYFGLLREIAHWEAKGAVPEYIASLKSTMKKVDEWIDEEQEMEVNWPEVESDSPPAPSPGEGDRAVKESLLTEEEALIDEAMEIRCLIDVYSPRVLTAGVPYYEENKAILSKLHKDLEAVNGRLRRYEGQRNPFSWDGEEPATWDRGQSGQQDPAGEPETDGRATEEDPSGTG